MKIIKKILSSIFLILILDITAFTNVNFANENIEYISTTYQNNFEEKPTPLSDIIDWRYKSENGKLYRRQYNYSKGSWVGEWELCE